MVEIEHGRSNNFSKIPDGSDQESPEEPSLFSQPPSEDENDDFELIEPIEVQQDTDQDRFLRIRDALDQMSRTLRDFVISRRERVQRSPFSLPIEREIPTDMRQLASLLAQGDGRRVEELIRTVHQNVVVNVNLSYYFKIMLVMLSVNTLLLFKLIVMDQVGGFGLRFLL